MGDNPVYEVVPEGTKRKPRVLHHNLLLPCPYLPLDIPAQAPLPKSTKNTPQRSPTCTPYSSTDDDSDDDKDVNDHISSGNAPSTSTSQPRTRRNRQQPVQLHYGASGTPGYVHPRVNYVNVHSSPILPSTYPNAQAVYHTPYPPILHLFHNPSVNSTWSSPRRVYYVSPPVFAAG